MKLSTIVAAVIGIGGLAMVIVFTLLLADADARPAEWRRATSTTYCPGSSGTITAAGTRTRAGVIAMNGVRLGTLVRVTRSPLPGRRVFQVTDRIGYGSQLDFWVPSCATARAWGRRTTSYRIVGWERPR